MTRRRRCVFCPRVGGGEEHVFANWIADALPGEGPFHLERETGKAKENMRYLGIKSRAACTWCNNEWMAAFEQAVQPLLTPAIRNTPVTWATDAEQETVARWAFKTALMLEIASYRRRQPIPKSHFEYLFKHRKPPPSATIFLAHYFPYPGEDAYAVSASSAASARAKLPARAEVDGYKVTLVVGHVIFVVYAHAGLERQGLGFRPSVVLDGREVDDVYRPLWPLRQEPHDWPPRGAYFTTSALDDLLMGG